MSVFDLIVLVILAALVLRGIWKGMISQIVSVASYFVCWIVATRFGSLIAPTIPVEAPWNQVLAAAIIFLVTLIAIRFAHAALEKTIKNWHLEKLNKLLGGLLGFAKGLLLCMILTFFAVMVSETSRAVVFNSKTGHGLVRLITQVGVFVPKDSYEFVHKQFAQFQGKVEGTVPGQPPETLKISDSAIVQEVLGQLQQTKETSGTDGAGSLWSALSKWWSGTKNDEPTATSSPVMQTAQRNESGMSPALYTAPPQQSSVPSQVSPPVAAPQVAVPQPVTAVEEFFVRQTAPSAPASAMQPLAALPSDVSIPSSSFSSPLSTLAPLTEILPIQPEPMELLPTLPPPYRVRSDLLLHNSGQTAAPDASARVFQP